MSTASGGAQPERHSLDFMDLLKYIGSPIAIATALLFYFGWVRSNSQAEWFGVDISVFELGTDDLVLRSINVLFYPLIAALLIALLFIRLDPWFRARARSTAPILRNAWVLILVGVAIILVNQDVGGLLLPLWFLAAVGLMAYGVRLQRHARGDETPVPLAQTLIVGALFVVMLFWTTERFARAGGTALVLDLQRDLQGRSPVSLLSEDRLYISAGGVSETALEASDGRYLYRYDGLYMLQRSGEKYFLLTDGWRNGMPPGRLLVLPDDDTIRLEFAPLR